MIIIRISGGIGNQLFQYALGRALSIKNNVGFKLDTSAYTLNLEPNRSFTLPFFNIKDIGTQIATNADFKKSKIPNPVKQGITSKIWRKMYRLIEAKKPLNKRKIILEPTFNFIPEIMDIHDNCYLSGVWQSEKYFKAIGDVIQHEFLLKNPLSEKAQTIKTSMKAAASVSMHIRRGDQVKDPTLLKKHGALTEEYYARALEYIKEKTAGAPLHIFVFSDDIDWVKNNMRLGIDVTYVSEYKLPDYEELTLMSYCKHNIIAKSSYSWWGAWLNPNPNKIVIAPQQRFGDPAYTANDLIPESWIQL